MPGASARDVRSQIAAGQPHPVYLFIGDDDVETARLAGTVSALVEDDLQAFNLEKIYAGEKGVTPAAIVQSARTLPMMAERRVVVVLRAEKILKPKRRGKAEDSDGGEPREGTEELEAYIKTPVPQTTLVFVAADADRTRRLYKTLHKHATIVECWGLKAGRDAKVDLREAARAAEQLVKNAVSEAGQQIEPAASRLLARRAGADIRRLRGDVDRLLLYAAGTARITLHDVEEVVSPEISHDDWAVTNAIQRRDAREALKALGLALETGGVPLKILGQLGWFVREKLPASDPDRVPPAVDALFRTDLDLKSSMGDPRVLLERLVVELCRG
jgi:DNA polymerase III subunit delta